MPVDLKELRRLHEAATPGPWCAHTPDWDEDTESQMSISMKSYMDDSACYRTVDLIEAYSDFYPEDADYEEAVANVQLIAAARNALPELLDRLEAAEAKVARLRERHTPPEIVDEIRRTQAEVATMDPSGTAAKLLDAAAQQHNRITVLETEVARLREALTEISDGNVLREREWTSVEIAREALGR